MQSKKWVAPFATIAVAAIALSACGSSSSASKTTGSSAKPSAFSSATPSAAATVSDVAKVTIGQEQIPVGFNNGNATANAAETTIIEEGLLPSAFIGQLNVTVAYNKDLFTSAPTLTSQSPETIVYHINPKAVWSDGVPINSADFTYAWQTQNGTNANYMAASTTGYSQIKSVMGSGTNDQTVTVVFSSPFADWQSLFGGMLPGHIMAPLGVNGFNKDLQDGLEVGGTEFSGGPYIIQKYDTNKDLIEVPNPKWYGATPHVKELVFDFIEDTTQFPTALQNGELDVVNPQPDADEVKNTDAVTRLDTKLYPQLTFEHIDFNEANSFLKDLKVREAIADAVSVKGVIAGTQGQFDPDVTQLGNRLILNNQVDYVDNSGDYGKGDDSAADALLTADGYTKSGQYYAKAGKTLEIGISTKTGNALRQSEEEIMQAQLMAAGIKLDIKNSDKSLGDILSTKAFDIALFAWVGGPFVSGNAAIYETATNSSTANYDNYSDPAVDKAFVAAGEEFDHSKADADYNAIDKMLWNDMATLPLYQKPGFLAYPKTLGNVLPNPTSDGYTFNVQDWGGVTAN